ncbi:RNA cap guanine-N2 methyltransferase-domain-containing protein [Gymnopilus junonius]|uniref:Trimethylguanosine synthase n=1 Tax=Gymnopilus junonius TaxID=109634 RepID=A0A9P5TH51_GYMJU|nr:RNA cap guanine-N2 methyltransferase-domain-containing protein [Gymnopilus junonius]
MQSTSADSNAQNNSSKTTSTTPTATATTSTSTLLTPEQEKPQENQNSKKSAERFAERDEEDNFPARKRRKANDGSAVVQELTSTQRESSGAWISKYDASELVPHYTDASQVPEHLKKYFSQRYRYFSQYSTHPGCLLDEEGWYSVTPESVADQIAERCRCDTVLDAFCGVGGNAIAFAKTCQRVIALDTSPTRLALARHNAQIYGVADRIEFILSDYISFVKSYLSLTTSDPPVSENPNTTDADGPTKASSSQNHYSRKIDVVFLSPPWGGPSYLDGSASSENILSLTPSAKAKGKSKEHGPSTPTAEHPSYSLSSIQPIHGAELFDLSRKVTKNIAYFLPRNTRLDEISDLLTKEKERERNRLRNGSKNSFAQSTPNPDNEEHVEIEEEWMGNKLKALTCYFGGLVSGQEDMF